MKNMLRPEFVNKWIVKLVSVSAAYEEDLTDLIEALRSQPNASDVAYLAFQLMKHVKKDIVRETLRELLKELPSAVV